MAITKRKYHFRLLLVSALTAVNTASALSTDAVESANAAFETNTDAAESSNYDDYFFIPHEGNSTLSATFWIRVTPEHYYIVSWTILWVCFALTVVFGLYQLKLERSWIKYSIMKSANNSFSKYNLSKRKYPVGSPSDPELGGGRKNFTTIGGRRVISSSRGRMAGSSSSASIQSTSGAAGDEQQGAVSSGDLARATVSSNFKKDLDWCNGTNYASISNSK